MLSYYANPKNICSKASFKAMLKPNTSEKVRSTKKTAPLITLTLFN